MRGSASALQDTLLSLLYRTLVQAVSYVQKLEWRSLQVLDQGVAELFMQLVRRMTEHKVVISGRTVSIIVLGDPASTNKRRELALLRCGLPL